MRWDIPFLQGPPLADLNARGTTLFGGADEVLANVGGYTGSGSARNIQTGVTADLVMINRGSNYTRLGSPVLGGGQFGLLNISGVSPYGADAQGFTAFGAGSFSLGTATTVNAAATDYVWQALQRRRGFMDLAFIAGNGAAGQTVSHNLGVAPEVMWARNMSTTANSWGMYIAPSLGGSATFCFFPANAGTVSNAWLNSTNPTATQLTIGNVAGTALNATGNASFVIMFASRPGVLKIGTYAGDGAANGPAVDTRLKIKSLYLFQTTAANWMHNYEVQSNPTSPWTKYWQPWSNSALATDANGVIVAGTTFRPPLSKNAAGQSYLYMAFG
jgi:hypothetical protein